MTIWPITFEIGLYTGISLSLILFGLAALTAAIGYATRR